jgi:hypothetical protein
MTAMIWFPDDIVRQILLFLYDEEEYLNKYHNIIPFMLTCKKVYYIAMNTPSIWRDMAIFGQLSKGDIRRKYTKRLYYEIPTKEWEADNLRGFTLCKTLTLRGPFIFSELESNGIESNEENDEESDPESSSESGAEAGSEGSSDDTEYHSLSSDEYYDYTPNYDNLDDFIAYNGPIYKIDSSIIPQLSILNIIDGMLFHLPCIENMHNIRKLTMDRTLPEENCKEDISIIENLTNLRILKLYHCYNLINEVALANLTNLKELHIPYLEKTIDLSIIMCLTKLEILYINYSGIEGLFGHKNLKYLCYGHIYIKKIGKYWPKLETITTDLMEGMRMVIYYTKFGTQNITKEEFLKHLPSIKLIQYNKSGWCVDKNCEEDPFISPKIE